MDSLQNAGVPVLKNPPWDPVISLQSAWEKMEKWGFQGVYVCMLLVIILCWGSMFHLRL